MTFKYELLGQKWKLVEFSCPLLLCAWCWWMLSWYFDLQRNSLGTIRNIANVCCVQFSAHSAHLLAFGSADYKTYCYDLRNIRSPWCILAGHRKAVSYVRFLDSGTIVTASTDSSLKLWDLNKTSHTGLSANSCSLTLSGHTNEKVGVFSFAHIRKLAIAHLNIFSHK